MQSKRILLLITAALLFLFYSCRKNYSDEQYIENTPAVKPDLSVKINTTVTGFIIDEAGNPVFGARVMAGTKETLSDEYGYFAIDNTSLAKAAGFVKVSKTGFFTGYKTFTTNGDKEAFVRIKMLTQNVTGTIDAASGGTVTTSDGGKITLPAGGVIIASTNSAYNGTIKVSARLSDITAIDDFQLAIPGDFRGIDTAGHLKFIKSYASIAVELTGNAGEKLQIAADKKATLTIPIASPLVGSAPGSIALWSFDETNGLWKQESMATKTGNNYVGAVSHFSYWSGATGVPLVNFSARVLNASLQPLANVPVMITQADQPLRAGYGKFDFTDANGFINGAIMANTNFVLDILTPCATSAYSHNFTTTNSDVDLGVLTGNLGQNTVTISGSATNCNNQPVTNGYVQTYDNGFYNRITITNGNFNFTGLACTNTVVNYVVVDNDAHQQNTPQSLTLVPGANDLGILSACGISTVGTITLVINGVTKTYTEPVDTMSAYFLLPNPWTTILTLGVGQNHSPDVNFQFDGGNAVGSDHKLTEIFSVGFASGRAYAPAPLTVTITEFGKTGGFISGEFAGLMLDFADNAIYNVQCSFRVKRFN